MKIIKEGSLEKDANFIAVHKDNYKPADFNLGQIFNDKYQLSVEQQPEGEIFKLFLSFSKELPLGTLHIYFALTDNELFLDLDARNVIFLPNRLIASKTQTLEQAAGFTILADNMVNINFISGEFFLYESHFKPQYQKLIVQMLKPKPELLHLFS